MKKTILIIAVMIVSISLLAQNQKVKWYTFEEVTELNKKEPRKVFIDVYTDWCGWCKKMDKESFQNPVIAKILNEKYYAVKFNAETKDTIRFKGRDYININPFARKSTHQLAAELLQGKMSYPSIAYLNETNDLITTVPGFYNAENLEPVLMYFAEDAYKPVSFEEYRAEYLEKNKEDKKSAQNEAKIETPEVDFNDNKFAIAIVNYKQDSNQNPVQKMKFLDEESFIKFASDEISVPQKNIRFVRNSSSSKAQFKSALKEINTIMNETIGAEVHVYYISTETSK